MPEPVSQLSQSDKEKLAAYEAAAARESKIKKIMDERRAICPAINDAMLRDIALAQVAHDERLAAAEAAKK